MNRRTGVVCRIGDRSLEIIAAESIADQAGLDYGVRLQRSQRDALFGGLSGGRRRRFPHPSSMSRKGITVILP